MMDQVEFCLHDAKCIHCVVGIVANIVTVMIAHKCNVNMLTEMGLFLFAVGELDGQLQLFRGGGDATLLDQSELHQYQHQGRSVGRCHAVAMMENARPAVHSCC